MFRIKLVAYFFLQIILASASFDIGIATTTCLTAPTAASHRKAFAAEIPKGAFHLVLTVSNCN